ncbi:MAG: hypothetical protein AAGA66_14380, partial [Bacteroidota bacterium]
AEQGLVHELKQHEQQESFAKTNTINMIILVFVLTVCLFLARIAFRASRKLGTIMEGFVFLRERYRYLIYLGNKYNIDVDHPERDPGFKPMKWD